MREHDGRAVLGTEHLGVQARAVGRATTWTRPRGGVAEGVSLGVARRSGALCRLRQPPAASAPATPAHSQRSSARAASRDPAPSVPAVYREFPLRPRSLVADP